ncbi:unnamed protein product [Pelagomonas calceolata]|uniref:Homeobox domain-containing protein n=1 Tax=Pelagomonas calceolata TaxID=35677 RepID=A0A8J2SQ77_9STRA|nr:unnamed protein product [Pelagomonas calceolata]
MATAAPAPIQAESTEDRLTERVTQLHDSDSDEDAEAVIDEAVAEEDDSDDDFSVEDSDEDDEADDAADEADDEDDAPTAIDTGGYDADDEDDVPKAIAPMAINAGYDADDEDDAPRAIDVGKRKKRSLLVQDPVSMLYNLGEALVAVVQGAPFDADTHKILNYLAFDLEKRNVDTTVSDLLSRDCIEPEKPPDGLVINFSPHVLDAATLAWREVHFGEQPTSFEGWSALEWILYSRSKTIPWYPRGMHRFKCRGSGGGRRRRRRRSRAAKDSVYKTRQFWTADEEQAVKRGVRRYGREWAVIRDNCPTLKESGRSDGDIRDKWRNMVEKDPTLVESVRAPVPAAPPAPAPATPAEEEEDDEVAPPVPKRSRIASQYGSPLVRGAARRGRTFPVHSLAECLASDKFSILEKWTLEHASKPYPTSQEKQNLAEQCGLERGSVDHWFRNMRKRKFFHLERGSRPPEDAFETQLLAFMRAEGMKPPAVPVVAAAPERARRVVTPEPVAPPAPAAAPSSEPASDEEVPEICIPYSVGGKRVRR